MQKGRSKNKYGYLTHKGVYELAEEYLDEAYAKYRRKGCGRPSGIYYKKFWRVVTVYLTHMFNDAMNSFIGVKADQRFGYFSVRKIYCTKYQKNRLKDGYHTYFCWEPTSKVTKIMWEMRVAKEWKEKLAEKVFVEDKDYLDVRESRDLRRTA